MTLELEKVAYKVTCSRSLLNLLDTTEPVDETKPVIVMKSKKKAVKG